MKKILFLIADAMAKRGHALEDLYYPTSIYIAGKITGDPDYRAKFDWARCMLTDLGFRPVINPAELPDGISYERCMKICFAMLDACEAVAFLPDWRESKGAVREFARALRKGKGIVFLAKGDV
ncbi:hypothetical protein SDC9_184280 [bioreactor metagenome]|uniref:DUF4406 domain-containing protein n=1 Tax=bioreactor metagenome TaxID=1076179 RepID=A0A645HF30_9ZZZZ